VLARFSLLEKKNLVFLDAWLQQKLPFRLIDSEMWTRRALHAMRYKILMIFNFKHAPKKIFSFARVKKNFKKKAKTGVVMTLFMDWATY
jgi:hypothetical protein